MKYPGIGDEFTAKLGRVYAAYETGEHTSAILIGYYTDEADARDAAKGRGWYSDGRVEAVAVTYLRGADGYYSNDAVRIDLGDIISPRPAGLAALKAAALAKLSPEERNALGI